MSYKNIDGNIYDDSNGLVHIGLMNQYTRTISEAQIIYQWQKFNLDTGEYEDDTTNITPIEGQTPTNGKVIIPYTPPSTEVTNNNLQILHGYAQNQPTDTIEDKTTEWQVTLYRNITQTDNMYTFEYTTFTIQKGTETSDAVMEVVEKKKDTIFEDITHPINPYYQSSTSASDLLKILFVLTDENDDLKTRVTALEAK